MIKTDGEMSRKHLAHMCISVTKFSIYTNFSKIAFQRREPSALKKGGPQGIRHAGQKLKLRISPSKERYLLEKSERPCGLRPLGVGS